MLKTIIPKVAYKKLISKPPLIKILEPEPQDGNINLLELVLINELTKSHNVKEAFEFGTFNGRTALNIAANINQGKVFTLDLSKNKLKTTGLKINKKDKSGYSDFVYINIRNTGELFKSTRQAKKIKQLYGDSATFDFSKYKNKIDLVFVDASHTPAYVKNDTEMAHSIVRPKGLILWHDYGVWHDVTKTLNQYYAKDKRFKSMRHIKGTSIIIWQRP